MSLWDDVKPYVPYTLGGLVAAWVLLRPSTAQAAPMKSSGTYWGNVKSAEAPEFYEALVASSRRLGVDPRELLKVMVSESGVNPGAVNANGGATGLIQIMPDTGKGTLGMSEDEWANFKYLTAAEQMPYVERYFKAVRLSPGSNRGEIYRKTFLPFADVGPGGELAYRDNDKRGWYRNNKGLDENGDGVITIDDLVRHTNYTLSDGVLDAIAQAEGSQ